VRTWQADYEVHPEWSTLQAIRNANWWLSYDLSALRLRPMSPAVWVFDARPGMVSASVEVKEWAF
jgi:hypothetical protein